MGTSEEYKLVRGLLDALRPIPLVNVSEWADENRRLTTESAAEPGKWRTSRTPYLQEIMDSMSPASAINEVIVMKGVQLGFTEAALNTVGCYIDVAPCPIMYVMPTIEMSKAISESRVDPMVENSPTLREKVRPARERDAGNTKYVKRFPGGILVLSGANSATSLRSRPVKVLMLDEVDAYPLNLDNEGSPIDLAIKRTSTFGSKRKIAKISTPTVEGVSVIEKEIKNTDYRKYMVPCPGCGTYQDLKFEQLTWDPTDYNSVVYVCPHCNVGIEERFKTNMLAAGKWESTNPDKESPMKRGYFINSLYSPVGWLAWSEIARNWDEAQGDSNKLRVFVNTILGIPWKEEGEAPQWENLYNRRESYKLNRPTKDVAFITAGIDVQKDRIELEIVGWTKGKRSYSLDYRVLLGDTSAKDVWDQLDKVMNERWLREDGMEMPLRLAAIDTGFNTTEVLDFCRRFDATRIIPVKGQDALGVVYASPRAVDRSRAGKAIGHVKIWHIGVSVIKSELYGWLRLNKGETGEAPEGYCFFPQYDQNYFRGITAETLEIATNKRGYMTRQWVKKYKRNEPLDCRVYARAAAAVLGMDRMRDEHFEQMAATGGVMRQHKPVDKKRRESRGSFWD